jgi:hypothetical protein
MRGLELPLAACSIERIGPDTLKMFVHDVFEIVTEIETGSPPHPFAAYPL